VKQNKPTTESDSRYDNLELMSADELLVSINTEDQTVPVAVAKLIPEIARLVEVIIAKMKLGGRLFYLGAGTSGRLGILDASECPPTFGVDHGIVVGLIAGGDSAIRKAVEFAEDDYDGGWKDLTAEKVSSHDVVIGIAASGTTPYVIGAMDACRKHSISTACITCNAAAPVIDYADFPLVCVVGPEVVTGSTRMKSGTAQKLILNMISTAVMVGIGRVEGNKMVDMQLANNKLIHRGTRMVAEKLGIDEDEARSLLEKTGNVRKAIELGQKK
jgi:N-acetylmuramic acid 6-phosphate etherase